MDAIKFDHVCFGYGETPVLKNATFSIGEGEFIGVIGPNGGGKTTLLRLIMGFLEPSSGTIEIFGKSPQESISSIAYVPQILRYDRQFPISVLELVLSGLMSQLPWYGQYTAAHKEAAMVALEKMGMQDFKSRSIGTLSGGQVQRALISRALVSQPKLLLLDEPTANVDSQAEADIYKLLAKLVGDVTILMVTHNLRACIEQVQRVLCVQGGVSSLQSKEVCEHFALGLYHAPLLVEKGSSCCDLQVKKK
jgi:zinc transport system ATP-binding protein